MGAIGASSALTKERRAVKATAGLDLLEIVIEGQGTNAACPHQDVDPVVVQAIVVMALQTIANRVLDPMDQVVLSITQVHGDTWNVIAPRVILRGTARLQTQRAGPHERACRTRPSRA